jgi:hypothetical protein
MTRRGFLGWTAVGATGLFVPELVRPPRKVFRMGRAMEKSTSVITCSELVVTFDDTMPDWFPRRFLYLSPANGWTGSETLYEVRDREPRLDAAIL